MPDSAQIIYREQNLIPGGQEVPTGIQGVMAQTVRGKLNTPDVVYSSWSQFRKDYGGFTNLTPDGALLIKRALDRGTKLRISRVTNYSDSQDPTSFTADLATPYPAFELVVAAMTAVNFPAALAVDAGAPVNIAWQGTHNKTMNFIAQTLRSAFPADIKHVAIQAPATAGSNILRLLITPLTAAAVTSIILTPVTLGPYTAVATTTDLVNSTADTLMDIEPIAPGADYNNLHVSILPGSNGQPGYFDAVVQIINDGAAVENYTNLYFLPTSNPGEQKGLFALYSSTLAKFTPGALAGFTPLKLTPIPNSFGFAAGTDGSAVTDIDYIGGGPGMGINAFDPYDDLSSLAAVDLDSSDVSVQQSGAAYAERRGDLVWMIMMIQSTNAATLIADRDATLIDSSWVGFYGGYLEIMHPSSGSNTIIPSIGDILGMLGYSQSRYGENLSFSGTTRGLVPNAISVVDNYGSNASKPFLDQLANRQINMVILRNNLIYLSGNFTGIKALSPLSYMNVRMTLIAIRKGLINLLEPFLEEPNDFLTWRKMYQTIEPFMQTWVDKRALYGPEGEGWVWQGDQNVTKLEDLQINNPTDVGLGKYKVLLFLKLVPSLQIIELGVIVTPAGISFTEALTLI